MLVLESLWRDGLTPNEKYTRKGSEYHKILLRICDEGDKDMPLKKSRFAWVNKMREERARREQRAADSVTEFAEARLRRKREERERYEAERERRQGSRKGGKK